MSRYTIIAYSKEVEIDRFFNRYKIIRWQVLEGQMFIEYEAQS